MIVIKIINVKNPMYRSKPAQVSNLFDAHAALINAPKAKALSSYIIQRTQQKFKLPPSNIQPSYYMPSRDSYAPFPGCIVHNYDLDALLLNEPHYNVRLLSDRKIGAARRYHASYMMDSGSDDEMSNGQFARMNCEANVKFALEQSAGQCEELTNFALLELLSRIDCDFSVEKMCFEHPLNHTFLVLNRDCEGTDAVHWQTWNETTVICDPWLSLSYHPSIFPRIWQHTDMILAPGNSPIPPDRIQTLKQFSGKDFFSD